MSLLTTGKPLDGCANVATFVASLSCAAEAARYFLSLSTWSLTSSIDCNCRQVSNFTSGDALDGANVTLRVSELDYNADGNHPHETSQTHDESCIVSPRRSAAPTSLRQKT